MSHRNNWFLWSVRGSCGAHYHRNGFYEAGSCHKCAWQNTEGSQNAWGLVLCAVEAQDWVTGPNRKWHSLCAIWCLQIKQEERRKERKQVLNISVSINNKLSKSLQVAPCRWNQLSGHSDWVSCCQQWNTTELTCHNPEFLLQPVGDVSSSLRVAGTLVPSYLLAEPKGRKPMHRQWEQGRVTCEEQRDELYRDGVRKAKAKLELGKTC